MCGLLHGDFRLYRRLSEERKCWELEGASMSNQAVIALTIGLPVFFVVFVLFRRSKTKNQ